MSRSATGSSSKNPPQLPSKSAWARGPPQNSATTIPLRSQSPAPPTPVSVTNPANFHATHSRRSSALGKGVSIKDGVSIPRSAVKQGSAVTFGPIDDASVPVSSSPASAPVARPSHGVKRFGSVAVQNGVSDAAKSAVINRLSSVSSTPSSYPAPPSVSVPSPVPKFEKKSIAKLFQGPSTQSVQTPPHEAASPVSRSASLLSQHNQGQPYPFNFSSGALGQAQNGSPSAPPRSPVYTRPMVNGQNGGIGVSGGRPQAGFGGTDAGSAPTAMPSPRMTPHAPPGPPSGMPPPPSMWPGYYYHPQYVSGVPPDQFYSPQWPSHLIPPQHQQPPPHHPPGAGPPPAALPMSPRNPPIQLQQVPGTPTQSHALPPIHHPLHPSVPHPPPSVTSPLPTPSTSNRPTSLSANPGAFVPGKKKLIKHPSGQEVNLDTLKRVPPPAVPIIPAVPPSPASVKKDIKRPIWIENQEQKEKRLAEEKARDDESEEKSKRNKTFAKANENAGRSQMEGWKPRNIMDEWELRNVEEWELRNVEELRLKEEAERADKEWAAREEKERKEAEERAAREEEERNEAEERAAREKREGKERERERLRLEEARIQREAEEKAQREWAEQGRLRKLREEEEGKEQRRRAEKEPLRAAEVTHALAADANPNSLPEEGENEDEASQPTTVEEALPRKTSSVPPPVSILTDFQTKLSEVRFRIGTGTSLPSPEHPRKYPVLRDLQTTTTTTSNSAPVLPSALSAERHIEDINRISCIKNPKVEFTQEGKLRAGTASVVPIESLLSDPYTKSPFTPKASTARPTGPVARPASFLGIGSDDSETPDGSRRQSDDPFPRHTKYFFNDGNVTFLVDGFLYCAHRYLFSHDSPYFSTRFAQLEARDHEALSTIVSLGDVECEEFEAFLSVLYPHFEEHDLSYEQWRSVLHLSTRWGFASRRKLALESIKPPTPYDRLLLARTYSVDHWVVPALIALCKRTAPLSLGEARRMNIEDVMLVTTVREDIFRFGMSAAEIPRRVEAMQAEVLVCVAGDDDVSLASSTSGPTVNTVIGSDSEEKSCNGAETAETEFGMPMSGGSLAGATTRKR